MVKSLNRRSFAAGVAAVGALGSMPRAFGQTPAATPSASPTVSDTRVVHAANGNIEVSGTPSRIVAMEYELVEHLQTVEITPIAVCERDSVNTWVNLPEPLTEDVVDLGSRDEPDLETLITLESDLILAAHPRQDAIVEQLEEIGLTVQLECYSPRFTPTGEETSIDHAKSVLRNVAVATNTEAVAEQKITEFDEFLAACAGRVAALGYAGQPYVYGSIILSDTGTVNLFTDLSRIAGTVSALGLTNAVTLADNPDTHFVQMSLEQIGTLPDDILFFYSVSSASVDHINATLESETWNAAGFVKNGGVIDLGEPNIWTAGGLLTMNNLITRVLGALEMREV